LREKIYIMAKKQVEGMRIGWLDSTRAPSHIHRTIDNGVTTVCGHPVKEMTETHDPLFNRPRWAVDPNIPRSIHGRSRYCVTCFKHGGKTIPFFTVDQNKGA